MPSSRSQDLKVVGIKIPIFELTELKTFAKRYHYNLSHCVRESIRFAISNELPAVEEFVPSSRALRPTVEYIYAEVPSEMWDDARRASGIPESAKDAKATPWIRAALKQWMLSIA